MTEDLTPQTPEESEPGGKWDPDTDPDGYTMDDVQPKDWYLYTVLDFVIGLNDENEGSVGLTVQSNGATVSGMAISRKEWIAGLVGQYAGAGAEETGKHIPMLFERAHEGVIESNKKRDDAGLPAGARRFLHMKDARILFGGSNEYVQLPFWRGKLSDITGWGLGSWNPPREASDEAVSS